MAVEQSSCYRLQSSQYLGEISALCLLHLPSHISSLPYLLAGSGSQLLVYDLEVGKMIRSFCVFQGIRVHGVFCSLVDCDAVNSELAFEVVVFGERRVKLFCLRIGMNESQVSVDISLLQMLPKFGNWVLDVCFLKGNVSSSPEGRGSCYLAVGCSDNSVHVWDISKCCVALEVQSPERSLLYSMRLWGDHLESLQIASGTIYNEIIIWKVVPQNDASPFKCQVEGNIGHSSSFSNSLQHHHQQYEAVHICKLVGHEGSIFRISWSSNGSNVVSVSDDRSVRVWEVCADTEDSNKPRESVGLVLFGHNARVWDCCIFDSFIVTAGEDCTCRVWGRDGKQLQVLKEHIGRGIWRCLCDPEFLVLITAGFDSAIKVHQLHASLSLGLEGHSDAYNIDRTNLYTVHIPNSSEHVRLMDSKSEYVRCLRFTCEDTLYVATNNGYLYHAKLSVTGDVYWTEIARVSEVVPIICMDLLSKPFKQCCGVEDWIALGDGKGNVTIIQVMIDVCAPKVGVALTWSAGPERQLLGTHWSKSLGCGYIFTTDPRGTLKLWRLSDQLQSVSHNCAGSVDAFFVAEFTSSFGIRIMCLDASFENEVLLCGDIRGNLVLFPLLKSVLLRTSAAPDVKISALTYFKGAHGISSVTSVVVAGLNPNQIEICSTGADGCICYFEYDRDGQILEFIGMKQVKELSLVQSVCAENNSVNELSICHYASGFASVDFMIWNLKTEMKVVRIPCGGWRRPHSYYLGDVPELKNCFAYVKDETIYIHRHWVPDVDRKMFPQNLHMQFHGKEMHTLCFISEDLQPRANGKHNLFSRSSWIATGCEDGTVRLTRYTPGVESWLESKLLGEHVGGSAVRSICCVSKIHLLSADVTKIPNIRNRQNASTEKEDNLVLLISVGAKRVLTSWLLRNRKLDNGEELSQQHRGSGNGISSDVSSSMSFQWLSTDMPPKYSGTDKLTKNVGEIIGGLAQNVCTIKTDTGFGSDSPEKGSTQLKSCIGDKCEDDWRYLAVTSFLVKCAGSRLTICFVVVACSNATLALRALVLPHRLWFDVAFLVPLSSPVLALQHVIIPTSLSSAEIQVGSLFVVISGATDGSIAFWDLTRSVEGFMRRISVLQVEKLIDCQKRPRTGRGSQGGRQWRSLGSMSKKVAGCGSDSIKIGEGTNRNLVNHVTDKASPMLNNYESSATVSSQAINTAFLNLELNAADDLSSEISEIRPLHVSENIHQSGVNCLHVSDGEGCQSSDGRFIYNVLSGGDDQALHCLRFEMSPSFTTKEYDLVMLNGRNSVIIAGSVNNLVHSSQNHNMNYKINVLSHYNVPSAHSSAVKGVWTDGSWVFSTGLDQRLRCWCVGEQGKLTEFDNVIVCVPEPEALDARVCSRDHYQIVVAGRGMQMVEFSTLCSPN